MCFRFVSRSKIRGRTRKNQGVARDELKISAKQEGALWERAGLLKRMYGIKIIVSREGRNSEEVEKAEKQKRAIWCGSKSSGLGRHRWVPSSWVESLASFFGIDHPCPAVPPVPRWSEMVSIPTTSSDFRYSWMLPMSRPQVPRTRRNSTNATAKPLSPLEKMKSAFLPLIRFTTKSAECFLHSYLRRPWRSVSYFWQSLKKLNY